MRRQEIVLSAFIIWASFSVFAADDTKAVLPTSDAQLQDTAPNSYGKKKLKTVKPYEGSPEDKVDVKKTKELIQAIDLILKNDRQVEAKVDLYVKKSYLLYSLGKKAKFNSPQDAQDTKGTTDETPYFEQSLSIVDQLQTLDRKKPLLSNQQRAFMHFIRGSINYELNKEKEMLKEYLLSLSYNKSTAQAASMELIIAEYYFENDKFDDAIAHYQSLYKIYDYQQKAIADYKTAWCYLIKKNYAKSESYFLRAINIKSPHSLVEDSIKDLAYISTQLRNEEQNLAFSRKTFPDVIKRGSFLLSLIRHMYAIDKKRIPYKLFNDAFKINKVLKEKVQILGILISYERREYPTKGQITAFGHMLNLVTKLKPDKVREYLVEAKQLPSDLEYYIKIFIDGYLQKIQSRKITDRKQFTDSLNKMIPFYIEYFATDKNILTYYSLWIDIGRREENLVLLESIRKHWNDHKALYSQTDLDLKIDNRVRIEIIGLLEKKKNPDSATREKLMAEMLSFSEKFPNDVNILPISKRISEIYLAEAKYKEAAPYLKTIYLKEPQAENYYNLKLAAFQMEDYESIANDPETRKYETDKRILELIRESRLKQAVKFYEKNDFSKYEESIKTYLDSKPDEKKSLIVYSDYFSKLIGRKQVEKFCSEYEHMSGKLKSSKEILKFVEASLDQIVGEGNYITCPAFTKFTDDASVNYKVILYMRAQGKDLSDTEISRIKKLEVDKRRLVLSILSLVRPRDAIAYYKLEPATQKEDKKIYLIALKMNQKTDQPKLVGKDIDLLKPFLPNVEVLHPIESKMDKQISQFFYPTAKMKIERYSKVMEDLFYRIKILRKTFLKESAKMPDSQKAKYLVKLAEVENKVGQVILDSPRPDDLSIAQLQPYEKQLAEAAIEYQNQGQEYLKVKEEIEKRETENKTQTEAQKVPVIFADQWFWPSGATTEMARSLLKEHGPFAALIYLEYQRSGGKLTDSDFSTLRAGLLLSYQNHETMRNYVRDELTVAGLTSVIDEWRKIK